MKLLQFRLCISQLQEDWLILDLESGANDRISYCEES